MTDFQKKAKEVANKCNTLDDGLFFEPFKAEAKKLAATIGLHSINLPQLLKDGITAQYKPSLDRAKHKLAEAENGLSYVTHKKYKWRKRYKQPIDIAKWTREVASAKIKVEKIRGKISVTKDIVDAFSGDIEKAKIDLGTVALNTANQEYKAIITETQNIATSSYTLFNDLGDNPSLTKGAYESAVANLNKKLDALNTRITNYHNTITEACIQRTNIDHITGKIHQKSGGIVSTKWLNKHVRKTVFDALTKELKSFKGLDDFAAKLPTIQANILEIKKAQTLSSLDKTNRTYANLINKTLNLALDFSNPFQNNTELKAKSSLTQKGLSSAFDKSVTTLCQ